jgi:hypothetical protein
MRYPYARARSATGLRMAHAVLLLFVLAAADMQAQEDPESRAVRPVVEGILQASDVGGDLVPHLGVAASLRMGNFSAGAIGVGMSGSAMTGAEGGPGSRLTLGYGGALLGYSRSGLAQSEWVGSILLGGGAAENVDSFGTSVGKDVFVVVEPVLGFALPVGESFAATGTLGYRWVGGVQDLGGPVASDLRSIVVRFGLRFEPKSGG